MGYTYRKARALELMISIDGAGPIDVHDRLTAAGAGFTNCSGVDGSRCVAADHEGAGSSVPLAIDRST